MGSSLSIAKDTGGRSWIPCSREYISSIRNLFDIKVENVAEVLPGYVAVIRSNVGLELERAPEGPERTTKEGKLGGPIHEDVEKY